MSNGLLIIPLTNNSILQKVIFIERLVSLTNKDANVLQSKKNVSIFVKSGFEKDSPKLLKSACNLIFLSAESFVCLVRYHTFDF